MKYNLEKHHRKSLRLRGYDYSGQGAYFVTICTQDRECLFGEIVDGEMLLNDAGKTVKKWWLECSRKFINVENEMFQIMPNHFHGIIIIVGADLCVCPYGGQVCPNGSRVCPDRNDTKKGAHAGAPLHRIIQWFKTMTTNEYLRNIKTNGWPRLNGKLWQRNYFERVIRNENEMYQIRQYIRNNPLKWDLDSENPVNR